MKEINSSLKIIMAILLVIGTFHLPIGYYQFLRIVASIAFCFLAYYSLANTNKTLGLIYIGLAILFQPIIPIYLGKEIWSVVDVVVSLFLVVMLIIEKKKGQ